MLFCHNFGAREVGINDRDEIYVGQRLIYAGMIASHHANSDYRGPAGHGLIERVIVSLQLVQV